MKYVYPAVFHPESDGGYSVYFPDIRRGATQGDTIAECIEMAEDFLCLALYRMEEENIQIPEAKGIKEVETESDEDIITLISVETDFYRRYYENKLVKKTLNIQSWLNERAIAANINFSQVLQKALKEELQIVD